MLTCIIALYNYLLSITYLYAPHKRHARWNAEYLFLLIIKKDMTLCNLLTSLTLIPMAQIVHRCGLALEVRWRQLESAQSYGACPTMMGKPSTIFV